MTVDTTELRKLAQELLDRSGVETAKVDERVDLMDRASAAIIALLDRLTVLERTQQIVDALNWPLDDLHGALIDSKPLRDRAVVAEGKITRALEGHVEKHGESPRYAIDDWQGDREPTHWEPYVICALDGTKWPCRTVRILTEGARE